MSGALKISNDGFSSLVSQVSGLISELSGNVLGDKQSHMVESRLKKRMYELKLNSPAQYLEYFNKNKDAETKALISLITTHHTFFFREFGHFEFLKKNLPEIVAEKKKKGTKVIKIWSAACSRGHEVYSLAMFFEVHLKEVDPSFTYQILGTDIDQESIDFAKNGVYRKDEIQSVPMNYIQKNWARGTGEIADFVKVQNHLRSKCDFKMSNLLKLENIKEKFDIIFCRNVLIYFDSDKIKTIGKNLLNYLEPTGYLITGISESLNNLNLPIVNLGGAVYQHESMKKAVVKKDTIAPKETPKSKIRVMCVDDSPSIIAVLKKILSGDPGFEFVGSAVHGKDAAVKIKELKPDVITLDIHMPEMDGISYLLENFSPTHPPVVMVSSVARSDSELAIKALKLGASDFVEKPSLQNMQEVADELKTKIKSILMTKNSKSDLDFDESFKKKIDLKKPQNHLCLVVAPISGKEKVAQMLRSLSPTSPAVLLTMPKTKELGDTLKNYLSTQLFKTFTAFTPETVKPGMVYFEDLSVFDNLQFKQNVAVYCCGGVQFSEVKTILSKLPNKYLVLEEGGDFASDFKAMANDTMPMTSFLYMAYKHFATKEQ